ncbi:DUF6122 family protein [Pontimicrobium sp. IMCC45349]|uniref:DUF6122 family protein n=1 Tax=Pontimicrobium sp. IMCC45349 TaxID=3391574 RepID=UPI00399F18F0
MYRPLAHYGIHFLVPLLIAVFFYKSKWKIVFIILISTMLIDLDHLLANPIFDPNRCSINFHPLHSYYAITAYIIMLIPKKTRILAIGLCIHIIADYTDCLLM